MVFLARPRQASWMPLGVLKGPWVTSRYAMNQELTKVLIHIRDILKRTAISVVISISNFFKCLCLYLMCGQDIQVNVNL